MDTGPENDIKDSKCDEIEEKNVQGVVEREVDDLIYQKSQFENFNGKVLKDPGANFYVVGVRWYRKWLDYIERGSEHPGEIDNRDIVDLEHYEDYFCHRSPSYQYANVILREEVQEGVDFVVCTEDAYKYIDSIYSHRNPEILRHSILVNDTDIRVEIKLKPLSLAIYPEVSRRRGIDKILLISHQEQVSNVQKIIKELLEPFFESSVLDKNSLRLWKMNQNLKLEKTFTSDILVPGTILNPNDTIEDSQITNEDLIIVEHCKNNGKWVLLAKESLKPMPKEPKKGIVGLQNLGNTCFMNSALQCVTHTHFLTEYFLHDHYKQDLNLNNPLGTKDAELAKTFGNLISQMWNGSGNQVSPWDLKKVIGKFASQFSGYQQHDSHELLSYLLTGLHEDLNKVKKKVYVEMPEFSSETPDSETAILHWNWFKKRNESVIVNNFYGQCKSTLVCPDCSKVSVMFDPVLSFAVVIPNSDIRKIMVNIVQSDFCKPIVRVFVTVKENWKFTKLKELLMRHCSFEVEIAVYDKSNNLILADDENDICDTYSKHIFAFENTGEKGENVPLILSRSGEKGFFSNSEKKVISMTRLLKIPLEASTSDIQKNITEKFQTLIEYNNHIKPSYVVNFVNTAKVNQGFIFNSKAPCDYCKKKCSNCPLGDDRNVKLKDIVEMRKNSVGNLQLEIEWNSQAKNLSMLNHFSDDRNQLTEISHNSPTVYSLLDCLKRSCNSERLDENNKWYCGKCKNHVRALKTYQMYTLPKYLILHLMRFKSKHFFSEKNSAFVEFPLEGLDLSEVVLSKEKPKLYDLYAVSNHFGGIGGGHYTAYIKHESQWLEMDDSRVNEVSSQKVVSSAAYLLFYKQRD